MWLKPSGIGCFCGDLPEEEQQLVYATHYAPAADLFLHNAPGVAHRTVGYHLHRVFAKLEISSRSQLHPTALGLA